MKKGTYIYVLLLALDRAAAAVLFNRPDITISALCWVDRNRDTDEAAARGYTALKLYWWQSLLLLTIGAVLEWIKPGHCAEARLTDIGTAQSTISLLL